MQTQETIRKTEEYVRKTLEGNTSDHDWYHIHRVRNLALHIAKKEETGLLVVELASLLHDIADWKAHEGDVEIGPRKAGEWLLSLGTTSCIVTHVYDIIRGMSFKGANVISKMPTLEGRVVQDADMLDSIGAIGIARCFTYGGSMGTLIHDPEIEPVLNGTQDAYFLTKGRLINPFYDKLLLLRGHMNTDTARKIAEDRHYLMEDFSEQFFQEWDGKDFS